MRIVSERERERERVERWRERVRKGWGEKERLTKLMSNKWTSLYACIPFFFAFICKRAPNTGSICP